MTKLLCNFMVGFTFAMLIGASFFPENFGTRIIAPIVKGVMAGLQ